MDTEMDTLKDSNVASSLSIELKEQEENLDEILPGGVSPTVTEVVIEISTENDDFPVVASIESGNEANPLLTYKNEMETWTKLQSQEQLLQLHHDTVTKITKGLAENDLNDLKLKLESYFNYISELFEAMRGTTGAASSPIPCIYFSDSEVKITIYEKSALSFSTNRLASSYPGNIIASRDILLGYLLKIPNQKSSQAELSKERQALVDLLKWVKSYGEKIQTFEQVIIVIPSWLKVENRMVLRHSAHLAQLSKCFLFTESFLAAIKVLSKASTPVPTVVIMAAGITRLEVAMYTILRGKVKMVAIQALEWDVQETDFEVKGCILPFFGKKNKLRRAMELQENKERVCLQTYDKAVAQLEEPIKQQKRMCIFLTESSKWNDAFKGFSELYSEDFTVVEMEEDFGLLTATKLSSNPMEKNLKALIDHIIPGVIDDMAQDITRPNE